MARLSGFAAYVPLCGAALVLFLIIHEIALRHRNERVFWFRRIVLLAMGLYLSAALALVAPHVNGFYGPIDGINLNLIPFHRFFAGSCDPMSCLWEILLFTPFGVLSVLSSYRCRKLSVTLLIGMGVSVAFEALQLLGAGSADIDDVILNTVGTLCGFLLGKLVLSAVPGLRNKVGVQIRIDNKLYRKRNDTTGITMLTAFILIAVILSGLSAKPGNKWKPTTEAAEIPTPSAPPPQADITEDSVPVDNQVHISADLEAKNAYLWDLSANSVLYNKECDEQIAPASTVKLLTALTALEFCGEDDQVLVGQEIRLIAEDASRAWLNPGNRLTVRQLLDAMLLPSGNDAAYALAVFSGRRISDNNELSIDKALDVFREAMNEKAAALGAVHSYFLSPDGYDTAGQYTTARDLALIAKHFVGNDTLRTIAESYRISDVWLSGQAVTYYNSNELINPGSSYYFEYATGLKTGKSDAAGGCLVSCADIGGHTYLCVVMGSTTEGRWKDSLNLYHAVGETAG